MCKAGRTRQMLAEGAAAPGAQGGFPATLTGLFHASIVSLNNLFTFEHWGDA